MKRLSSSDSLGAMMTICPATDKHSPRNNQVYSRDPFQTMMNGLDEEGCVEESGHLGEKKRRLRVDQVKALEKNFEVENKLEPERKVKLAQELGLQPRQVAVWFQNRRARWKTKQLERDHGVLNTNYEALKLNLDTLQQENEALRKEIQELISKLEEENTESDISVKEEVTRADSEGKLIEQNNPSIETPISESQFKDFFIGNSGVGATSLFTVDFKDGTSDSDSSAILNEDNSPNAAITSYGLSQIHPLSVSPPSSSMNSFQFQKTYPPAYVKMEEHDFFGGDETCDFFSEEQAPTLQWYCTDQWNWKE